MLKLKNLLNHLFRFYFDWNLLKKYSSFLILDKKLEKRRKIICCCLLELTKMKRTDWKFKKSFYSSLFAVAASACSLSVSSTGHCIFGVEISSWFSQTLGSLFSRLYNIWVSNWWEGLVNFKSGFAIPLKLKWTIQSCYIYRKGRFCVH